MMLMPHNHALFADKQNLVLLSDPAELARIGVPASLSGPGHRPAIAERAGIPIGGSACQGNR
jgi:hypothetical protein